MLNFNEFQLNEAESSNSWIYNDDYDYSERKKMIPKIVKELKKISKPMKGKLDIYERKTIKEVERFLTDLKNGLNSTADQSIPAGGNFKAQRSGFILQISTNTFQGGEPCLILVKVGGATPGPLKTALTDYIASEFKKLKYEPNDDGVWVDAVIDDQYATNWSWVSVQSPLIDGKHMKINPYDVLESI